MIKKCGIQSPTLAALSLEGEGNEKSVREGEVDERELRESVRELVK